MYLFIRVYTYVCIFICTYIYINNYRTIPDALLSDEDDVPCTFTDILISLCICISLCIHIFNIQEGILDALLSLEENVPYAYFRHIHAYVYDYAYMHSNSQEGILGGKCA